MRRLINKLKEQESKNIPIIKILSTISLILRRIHGHNNKHHNEYYGLIDRSGKIVTAPEYTSIEAIAEDLYLCQPQGIIINGKGQQVK